MIKTYHSFVGDWKKSSKMKSSGGALILCLIFVASVSSGAIKKEGLDSQSGSSYPPTYPPTSEWYPTTRKPTYPTEPTYKPTTREPTYPTDPTYRPTTPRTSAYPTSPKPTYPDTTPSHKPTYPDTTPWTTHKPPENVSCFFHTIYKEKHDIIMEGDENIHETPEQCETSCYVSKIDFLHCCILSYPKT